MSGGPETLPAFYEAAVARGLDRDPAQLAVVARLEALRTQLGRRRGRLSRLLRSPSAPRGVYLWGDVGRGKSMLAEGLMATLGDIPARRVHFHVFMRGVHRALHAARQAGRDDPLHHATDRETEGLALLALDELEITDIVDATIVGRVFQRLLDRRVVVLATSNRAPPDLYRDGLKRELFLPFVALIETQLDVLHLDGARDYRVGDDGAGPDLYLMPRHDHDRERIEALWTRLPGEREENVAFGGRGRLSRKGRAFRGNFDTLCRAPVAPASYIDLAETARLLIVEGVPQLRAGDHDAARRFVFLVDTLYEAQAGIVVAADVPPEDLYRSGEFEEEFRRTVSRLHEMTRPDWPGRPKLT